ncbi:MAG: hypothetical protein K2M94_00070 [Paramuribaculum sp.]|nr:hypothetical protein [Paramuribaculum sp.]
MATPDLSSFSQKIKALFQSARGRDLLLYLLCVVAATFIWVFLTLDDDIQKDYEIPLIITDIPKDVTPLSAMPEDIAVSVSGKGMAFVKYSWGKMPSMKVPFNDFVDGNGVFRMSKTKIESWVHDYFGANITVNATRPDSIVVRTTDRPGKKVPLIINVDATTDALSIISGRISANVDSIMLFSAGRIPESIMSVSTIKFRESDLSDSLYVKGVRLQPVDGITMIPASVDVMIPVEPLIAKKKTVNINVVNVPRGMRIIPFPYSVEVAFLVPMSKYSMDYKFNATVDYHDVVSGINTLNVNVTAESKGCYNVSFTPEKVDYVVEYIDNQQE